MAAKKNILVAPVNWGLGHASRCIPIIHRLQENNFNVILASDGQALQLLRKEFPSLKSMELPAYKIQYSRKGYFFKLKMISQLLPLWKTIQKEHSAVRRIIKEEAINGIISDGRLGIRSSKIPSVYITHQLILPTGGTTGISSFLHRKFIKKFDCCWVPDDARRVSGLSGKLGHLQKNPGFKIHYLGILSRFKKNNTPISIDYLAVLSGPEPQRTLMENKLLQKLISVEKRIVLVKGIIEDEQKWEKKGNIDIVNFLNSEELEDFINKAEVIISRSGYSTIMDLAKLKKKAFFIPTPGQYEQEYLAKRLHYLGMVPFCTQDKFEAGFLAKASVYNGLDVDLKEVDFKELFEIFGN